MARIHKIHQFAIQNKNETKEEKKIKLTSSGAIESEEDIMRVVRLADIGQNAKVGTKHAKAFPALLDCEWQLVGGILHPDLTK
jgi:hypothetical protein